MKETLVVLVLLSIMSCASYQPSTEYNFVKVLGVTTQGDTILIDVNSLRPKVYNNYIYRNGYNQYPYNYWNNPPVIIRPYNKPNRPIVTPPTNKPPFTKPTTNPSVKSKKGKQ